MKFFVKYVLEGSQKSPSFSLYTSPKTPTNLALYAQRSPVSPTASLHVYDLFCLVFTAFRCLLTTLLRHFFFSSPHFSPHFFKPQIARLCWPLSFRVCSCFLRPVRRANLIFVDHPARVPIVTRESERIGVFKKNRSRDQTNTFIA